MRHYWRITRPLNLFFVGLVQVLVYQVVVLQPWMSSASILTLVSFSFSTICITAAGYVINDIYDRAIDTINAPNKVVVGSSITTKQAKLFYVILNTIGAAAGFFAAYLVTTTWLGLLPLAVILLLLFYARTGKRMFLIGNILVSLLTMLLPIIVGLYFQKQLAIHSTFEFSFLVSYSILIFLLSFIREVIKDMEDVKGDAVYGCKSIPIVYGMKVSVGLVKMVSVGLLVLLVILMRDLTLHWWWAKRIAIGVWLLIGVVIPLLYLLLSLKAQKGSKYYRKFSRLLKMVMFIGVLSMLFFT